jgi:hypothetical protein
MGRESEVQSDPLVTWAERPRSPGHVFYDRLQKLLERGQLRRLRRANLQTVLRAEDGRAVVTAWPLFSHAHDRLLRRDRQRTEHCLALFQFAVIAVVFAAGEPGRSSRSFVAVEGAHPPAARSS